MKVPEWEEMEASGEYDSYTSMAIAYAKMHVQAQRDAILEVLNRRGDHNNIDKNIIINTYPDNLII